MATTKKSVTKSAPKKGGSQDAIKLLTADHREVKGLFDDYQELVDADASADERQALAERICAMLTVHATIEEEIFYPAAREALDDEDLLDEAEVEHASAKDLIAQIEDMDADDDLYDAKVTVLGEYIDHHVQEEEGEMFPMCRESGMDLAELGLELETRKADLIEETMDEVEAR
jgi:hemerythrin superfamily protein